MTGFRYGRRRLGALSLVLVAALLVGAGCGKPAYTYVANTKAKTYFKVPSGWAPVDTGIHDYEFAQILFAAQDPDSQAFLDFKSVRWSVQYDSPTDTGSLLDAPSAYGLVTPVPSFVQNGVSLDAMRDLLAPVSQAAQRQAIAAGDGLPPGFEVLDDELLTPEAGMRGVRVVYNRANGNALFTYDLTVMTNNDSSLVYILILWCSTQCYRKNAVEINDVVTSFTVRNAP